LDVRGAPIGGAGRPGPAAGARGCWPSLAFITMPRSLRPAPLTNEGTKISSWLPLPVFRAKSLRSFTSPRRFEPGDVVETCYCLPLSAAEIRGTFYERIVYSPRLERSAAYPDLKLFPLGLGLLYSHSDQPNMVVDYHMDELGAHWLSFRAERPIGVGEELTVYRGNIRGPVLEAAAAWVVSDLGGVPSEPIFPAVFRPPARAYASLQARDLLRDLSFGHGLASGGGGVRVGRSPVQGLGVFACRDFSFGDVVDICPVLKVLEPETPKLLGNYAFHSTSDDVDNLPLGASMILNHSSTHFNVTWWPSAQSDYVIIWLAACDIKEGAELFHHYGKGYWDRSTGPPLETAGDCTQPSPLVRLLYLWN